MQEPPHSPHGWQSDRLAILGLILSGWALIVVLQLFHLQVFAHERYVKLAESQQDRLEPIEATRGAILDRNGSYLAISSASRFVVLSPRRIPNKEIAAALLGRILGLDPTRLQADLEAAALSKHHRGYFVADPNVSEEKADTLRDMKLDWLEIREGSLRSYPNGSLAAHIVGNVTSDNHGAAGVELKLDKELAGKPGLLRTKVDVKQRAYESETAASPTAGKNIALTIDSELQHLAQDSLRDAVIKNHADHGSMVAMDPRTGEVLALANYPTYDLNERLHAGEKAVGREDLAVVAPFEPGSVFKVVTLSAAMETTNLTPLTMINCGGGVMTMFTRVIHDSHPYGALTVQDVLAKSSNIGAIRIGMQVGSKNLYEYVRRFGFGHRTGIELPAEAPGLVRPLKRWQPTSIGSVPMGHEVSVTSLQLAQLGSVIANGGFLVHPHLVLWEQAPGSKKIYYKTTAEPFQVLKPQTVMTMRMMMHRVTMPGGTAQRLHVPGYTFSGKTGTAQIYDFAHHVYTHKYNASFLGYAPSANPQIVVVVTVSGTTGNAGFGGAAAGPVFDSVMETALRESGVPRDVPEEIDALIAKDQMAKDKSVKDKNKDGNDVAIADLSTPFTAEEMKEAAGEGEDGDAVFDSSGNQVVAEYQGPRVPDFVGKTVKDVVQEAASEGVEIDMFGDGMARRQSPPAGAPLNPGAHIQVRFAR